MPPNLRSNTTNASTDGGAAPQTQPKPRAKRKSGTTVRKPRGSNGGTGRGRGSRTKDTEAEERTYQPAEYHPPDYTPGQGGASLGHQSPHPLPRQAQSSTVLDPMLQSMPPPNPPSRPAQSSTHWDSVLQSMSPSHPPSQSQPMPPPQHTFTSTDASTDWDAWLEQVGPSQPTQSPSQWGSMHPMGVFSSQDGLSHLGLSQLHGPLSPFSSYQNTEHPVTLPLSRSQSYPTLPNQDEDADADGEPDLDADGEPDPDTGGDLDNDEDDYDPYALTYDITLTPSTSSYQPAAASYYQPPDPVQGSDYNVMWSSQQVPPIQQQAQSSNLLPLPTGADEPETERRLQVSGVRARGPKLNTLEDFRARRGSQSLPDAAGLVRHNNVSARGSLSSLSRHNSVSARGSLSSLSTVSHPTASMTSGVVRTQKGTRQRRTHAELQHSPTHQKKAHQKRANIDLSSAEEEVVQDACHLYLVDICTVSPWRDAKGDKGVIMKECLNQANIRASSARKQTLSSEHFAIIARDTVGPAGSIFRNNIKRWLETNVANCWDINPSPAERDTMSAMEQNLYKQRQVVKLLHGDAFAHCGYWSPPKSPEMEIPHWFNHSGLHRAIFGLFFDPTSKIDIARLAPDIFGPNFPLSALSLVTGIAKHVLGSIEGGVVKSRDMREHGARKLVIAMGQILQKELDNEVLKVPMERTLRKISNMGRESMEGIPGGDPNNPNLPEIDFNLTLFATFGTEQVSAEDWDAILGSS